ncbi:MAG: PEP-CTERM sorting domain-containing protein [Acidiphilium sp.]|nr:PEP-CTERM sorting domain-containing protein [Acidiphilium sp.]MDD4935690.1 PEP-CTERM sorting domain-containing protein [Acidiphilium sp.]
MWIIRCAQICRGVIASHPVVAGIPAAVTTVGAGAALAVMLASPPAKPQLPCGCHQVWVAPVVPMTPQTYGRVMKALGDVALAGVPLDNAPGGLIDAAPYVPPTNLIPANGLTPLPHQSGSPPASIPGMPTTPTSVPEPSTIAVLATGLAGLAYFRRAKLTRL